ncbi:MAG: hypothetical protein V1721_09870, partial [Pseudomonadota bacterium]
TKFLQNSNKKYPALVGFMRVRRHSRRRDCSMPAPKPDERLLPRDPGVCEGPGSHQIQVVRAVTCLALAYDFHSGRRRWKTVASKSVRDGSNFFLFGII